jgi:hypothetical protein
MAHVWQHHFGKPGRRGYHNAEWAKQMHAIGLKPTSTVAPGGKETGEKVTHMVDAGGPFDRACAALLKTGLTLAWHDLHGEDEATKKKNAIRAPNSVARRAASTRGQSPAHRWCAATAKRR